MTFDARKLAHGIHGADCAVHDVLGTSHGWRCERTSEALTAAFEAGRAEGREKTFAEIQEALSQVSGFRAAVLKVEEWRKISNGLPENQAAAQAPSGKAR